VVTGASSGIGKCIALALAEQGARIWLIGRSTAKLEDATRLCKERAPHSRSFRADLTRSEDIEQLVTELQSDRGCLHVLIHSAGLIHHGEHASASVAELDAQYQANVRAPYLLTQALLPLLRREAGQIVFINSSSSLHARARSGQFAATQHAMKAIADSLREEVNADGIRVLSVYPGRTATPRTEQLFREERKAYKPELLMQPEDIAAMVVQALRLPPTAEVTDMSIRPLYKSY
jgi:short-subunit dehydrogenase